MSNYFGIGSISGLGVAAAEGWNSQGPMYPGTNLYYMQRLEELKEARKQWLSHWRDIARLFCPERLRYLEQVSESMGGPLHGDIVDNTAELALQTSSAGMQSGVSSPARRWFSIDLADDNVSREARAWMDMVLEECYDTLRIGGFYDTTDAMYTDLLAFGTCALLRHRDERTMVRYEPLQPGEYCIAMNNKNVVDTLYREWYVPARVVEQQFVRSKLTHNERVAAWNKLSNQVRVLLNTNNGEAGVPLVACTHPAEDSGYEITPTGYWKHVVFEQYETSISAPTLHEGFFDQFPAFVARWKLTPPSPYGRSQAMKALGDARQLQDMAEAQAEAIRQIIDPPMVLPTSFRGSGFDGQQGYSNEHGSQNYGDTPSGVQPAAPAFQVRPQLQEMLLSIEDVRRRIHAALHSNLFNAITDLTRREITAQEILAREEERLLVLGSPMERLDREFLRPNILWLVRTVMESGRVPPPPEELIQQQTKMRLTYRNIVAQAQRVAAVNDLRMAMATAAQLAAVPQANEALLVLDWGAAMREILKYRDIPEDAVRSEREVRQIVEAQAQAQAQQHQAMLAEQQGKAAKLAAETNKLQGGL